MLTQFYKINFVMKTQKIILITIFSIFFTNSFSQTYKGKYFSLDDDHTGNNETYIARDYIKLTDGFRYTAQANKTFVGKIDPSLVYETNYTDDQTPWSSNLPVGSLPGSVNVSPTGAATYQNINY